jgi:hypothetical protein
MKYQAQAWVETKRKGNNWLNKTKQELERLGTRGYLNKWRRGLINVNVNSNTQVSAMFISHQHFTCLVSVLSLRA